MLHRLRASRLAHVASVRYCSSASSGAGSSSKDGRTLSRDADDTAKNTSLIGAIGSRGARGSGKSLMGSAARGARSAKEIEMLKSGAHGWDGEHSTDQMLEGSDVLMEVLAEDHRSARTVEFADAGDLAGAHQRAAEDAKAQQEPKILPAPKGPLAAQRKYLSHRGVSGNTVFARQHEAGRMKAEAAFDAAFVHRMPDEAKAAREAHARSRARQRDHDIVENRIQEAMASGAFEQLPGMGKPLSQEENVWEAIAGEAMANRILKNAGCAPAWVERNKEIRGKIDRARDELVLAWGVCVLRASDAAAPAADAAAVTTPPAPELLAAASEPSEVEPLDPIDSAAATAPWHEASAEFESQLATVNKMIKAYNLTAPATWQQLLPLRLTTELEHARRGALVKAVDLRDNPPPPKVFGKSFGEVPAAPSAGAYLAASQFAFGGAEETRFATADAEYPGIMASLSAAIFSPPDAMPSAAVGRAAGKRTTSIGWRVVSSGDGAR